jgi:hypothetical protein
MDNIEHARAEIGNLLERALLGQTSFIETARAMNGLVEEAGFDRLSEPFVRFVGIDSETDHIPLGKVRDLWQTEAIERHRADWDGAEAWAKQFGEQACREALELVRDV